jgi:hypothetical protein
LAKSIEKKIKPGETTNPPSRKDYRFQTHNEKMLFCVFSVTARAANPQTVPDCGPGLQSLRSPSL